MWIDDDGIKRHGKNGRVRRADDVDPYLALRGELGTFRSLGRRVQRKVFDVVLKQVQDFNTQTEAACAEANSIAAVEKLNALRQCAPDIALSMALMSKHMAEIMVNPHDHNYTTDKGERRYFELRMEKMAKAGKAMAEWINALQEMPRQSVTINDNSKKHIMVQPLDGQQAWEMAKKKAIE